MNTNVTAFKGQPVDRAPADLAGRLVWLTRFGKPSLSVPSSGWHCRLEMHVADAVKGATFDVRSEFGMATPEAAVDQCITRMLDALAKLGSA